jgi:hypothetical protein
MRGSQLSKIKWGPASLAVSFMALVLSLGGTSFALTQTGGVAAASHTAHSAKVAALPAWHNLALRGGWTFGAFNSYRPAYYIDSNMVVHLRGSAVNGNPAIAVFQLPNAARPAHELWLPIYAANGAAGGLKIQPNGLAFVFDATGNGSVIAWSSFDGVTFRVP